MLVYARMKQISVSVQTSTNKPTTAIFIEYTINPDIFPLRIIGFNKNLFSYKYQIFFMERLILLCCSKDVWCKCIYLFAVRKYNKWEKWHVRRQFYDGFSRILCHGCLEIHIGRRNFFVIVFVFPLWQWQWCIKMCAIHIY